MPSILKKLRLKFMATTIGIVAVLVIVIAGAYCITFYNTEMSDIDTSLDRSLEISVNRNLFQDSLRDAFNSRLPLGLSNEEMLAFTEDQRIDIFHGREALVYAAVVDTSGAMLRVDSPAVEINESALQVAISTVLREQPSTEDRTTFSGRVASYDLFYKAQVQGSTICLTLTDSSSFDNAMRDIIFGACILALITLTLTVVVSFFLARLFLRPVEDAWNKQRRFIADASHELKTPLTVIMANTEIVRSNPEDKIAEHMKWLDGTIAESDRMHGLIADLLLLARMDDEGTVDSRAVLETLDLSEACENTVLGFEAVAFERGLQFESALEENLQVRGMRSRLVRLPDILVDNACKYAEEGGLVEVTLKRQGNTAVLRVFNEGPEISEADLSHLFDRFYRADQSRSDDIPGYGLGLSIAQSIVAESGGTITAENISNKGVALTVTLPLAL